MTRMDRTFLLFTCIAVVGGICVWLMNMGVLERALLAGFYSFFLIYYMVLQEFSIIKQKNDLIFDLLWKMSFHVKMDDCDRAEIREKISMLEKERK